MEYMTILQNKHENSNIFHIEYYHIITTQILSKISKYLKKKFLFAGKFANSSAKPMFTNKWNNILCESFIIRWM